jgi:hypothetical protein
MPTIVRSKARVKTLPTHRRQFDLPAFAAWLSTQGAEIGVPTNAYEVIRYKAHVVGGRKAVTHIVYTKENGLLTFMGSSRLHYEQMLGLTQAEPVAIKVEPSPTAPKHPNIGSVPNSTHRSLLARDGDECWFCGKRLGSDITTEHLVPKSAGGGNKMANYALAHRLCNQAAADMPLVKKIELRAKMRTPIAEIEGRVS